MVEWNKYKKSSVDRFGVGTGHFLIQGTVAHYNRRRKSLHWINFDYSIQLLISAAAFFIIIIIQLISPGVEFFIELMNPFNVRD